MQMLRLTVLRLSVKIFVQTETICSKTSRLYGQNGQIFSILTVDVRLLEIEVVFLW